MNIKTNILALLLLFGIGGCSPALQIARTEKKIIRIIDKKISDDFMGEKEFTFSDNGNYVLVSGIKNQMEPAFVHVMVFDSKNVCLFESKNEYRKAYWKGDVLYLEKIIGQLEAGEDITKKYNENRIIYQLILPTNQLQRVESAL